MLELIDVTKRYKPDGPPALLGASMVVQPGEFVVLMGPSGAGKSTLLRCLNGLVRPDSGRVRVGGREVTGLDGSELQDLRRQVGMIFQEFQLIERLPVLVNVISGRFAAYPFWRSLLGLWSRSDLEAVRRMLDRVGLAGLERSLARELSGGQRQRVAIARAMMQQPRVLLGDEPVASLDPVTGRGILDLVAELTREQGLTTILSLHDVGLARAFGSRAVGVNGGRILFDGPISELTDEWLERIYHQGQARDARRLHPFLR